MVVAGDNLPYMENLLIDFSLLSSPSPVVANEELKKLRGALNSWGCFQLVNHGLSVEYLDKVRDVGKQFFALPQEEREKYSRTPKDMEGYGNDSITSNNVPLLWQYRIKLTTHPLENRRLHLWPLTPPSFREVLDDYSKKMISVHDKLVQEMARCLNLEKNSFLDEYGEKTQIIARYQTYIPCTLVDKIRASSEHADSCAVTFLLQDQETEALEVKNDGKWYKAPVFPHAIFVNVGDQMEIMSNGIFKSAIHRVVPHPTKERISMPLFCGPSYNKEIGPLPALITQDRPAHYKRVKNYIEVFFRYHPTGIPPITTVKVGKGYKYT